jgi:hypothetical protein
MFASSTIFGGVSELTVWLAREALTSLCAALFVVGGMPDARQSRALKARCSAARRNSPSSDRKLTSRPPLSLTEAW